MRKFLFAIITLLIFLIVLELAARVIEHSVESVRIEEIIRPGWQAKFFGRMFDWHEPDPDLLWRFKANLNNPLIKTNSNHLIGDEVTYKKKRNAFRVLLLGDSSPVGLGLDSYRQAFGQLVRYHLDLQLADTIEVELINASVSGYTSEQLKCFLEYEGWKYQPDVVLLYCGNNDASVSGQYSDRELLDAQRFKALRKALHNLAMYRVLTSVLARSEYAGDDELVVRVAPERFSQNLREIAEECRRHDCPLVILKPPVPYLWPACLQFKPFAHITGEKGEVILPEQMRQVFETPIKFCINEEMFEKLYGEGDKFTRAVYSSAFDDTLSPIEAVEYYTDLFEANLDDPVITNNLGVSLWEAGEYDKANGILLAARKAYASKFRHDSSLVTIAAGSPILFNIGINLLSSGREERTAQSYLDSALQSDYFSLRIKPDYWQKIDDFKGKDGVFILDLVQVFRDSDDEPLFIDHCHPTARGHALIASQIAKLLAREIL